MQHIPQPDIDQLSLWYVLQYSLSSFHRLLSHFGNASDAIQLTALPIWQQLKLHPNHLQRLQIFHSPQGQQDFQTCLKLTLEHCDSIIFKHQHNYPVSLSHYDDSPPILFVQGDANVLQQPQIAMVGSRQPGPHGKQVAYDFANFFAEQNFVVTSGLALGIDAASHHGAIQNGKSIAVIGTGLDQCYPSEHRSLWQGIIEHGGAIVSEFLANTPPAKRNFPRRNRMISGLSQGTVVVEAGLQSGSLITAKKAAEQGKQVFAIPGHIYSQYHQGCHQLIREGATLVDHPLQVIEDLNMFGQAQVRSPAPSKAVVKKPDHQTVAPQTESIAIPEHLNILYQQLDWVGISIDELAIRLNQNIIDLNIALVELELLGMCKQHGGRYLRC
ncbi:MAG: DNA-processing protein DprA [Acinetobacter populi]|jgi:DNA processing protein|uniref:DNA-processing protein DprA n=1 Tax=Acinetobacter populi TaxID=1582270 RepID=UPI0023522E06|nr:DNA-processing protein DprA [Acinetobacter populi]MCH4246700.1 DNA-processing protein DprA [Acinetobacter populi]